jgi:predicted TIM-barrel fold metal-dependent hydrolase
MVIDCHTHLGRNEHIKATADELLRSMDKAGIDKSLVFAGQLNDAPIDWILEQVAPHKDRLYVVADYVHNSPMWAQHCYLRDLYRDQKIVAVKFYTGYDHYYPVDISGILSELELVGCPAIFHSGDCLNSVKCAKLKYAHPINIDEVAVDYPKMNFIIAHMAYPWVRDAAEVCYKNANVYSDFSGFVYGEFEGSDVRKFSNSINSFLDIAGNDKLLFGTDWPISNQSSYVKTVETLFEQSLCPAPEFLSQNVRRAFKLP